VNLRYIVCLLVIIIKGMFKTYNHAGTFVLPFRLSIVILLTLLIWSHHMDTIIVILLVCLNLTLYLEILN